MLFIVFFYLSCVDRFRNEVWPADGISAVCCRADPNVATQFTADNIPMIYSAFASSASGIMKLSCDAKDLLFGNVFDCGTSPSMFPNILSGEYQQIPNPLKSYTLGGLNSATIECVRSRNDNVDDSIMMIRILFDSLFTFVSCAYPFLLVFRSVSTEYCDVSEFVRSNR